MKQKQRNTIDSIKAEILSHQHLEGEQHILRLRAASVAEMAKPGSFIHLTCDSSLPLRRPISIMRVSAQEGWIELLYKAVGQGTKLLSKREEGEKIDLIGPIGKPFTPHLERNRPLLIGGGVGMPPMIFLADSLREIKGAYDPLVILGSEVPFPFTSKPSKMMTPYLPDSVIAAMPLLEDWGIASRLASLQGYLGCHQGYVTDPARAWLESLNSDELGKVEIFSCGPEPMLKAVAALAKEFHLPCQVSMEEYMACGVGGCAGCVVEVKGDNGPQMQRVCVDGPVFDARRVFS